jgi:hypothetical protein
MIAQHFQNCAGYGNSVFISERGQEPASSHTMNQQNYMQKIAMLLLPITKLSGIPLLSPAQYTNKKWRF